MPLIDILIVWGFVRFAANLKVNLAGVLIILLTASLTIPSSFLNLTHGVEPIFLLHALAAGRRESAPRARSRDGGLVRQAEHGLLSRPRLARLHCGRLLARSRTATERFRRRDLPGSSGRNYYRDHPRGQFRFGASCPLNDSG
jgi:hypothetical protein